MAGGRPRKALALAVIDGSADHDPARFKERTVPESGELGPPPVWLTKMERDLWLEESAILPWLRAHHRYTFAAYCSVIARFVAGERTGDVLDKIRQYSNILGTNPSSDQRFGKPEEKKDPTAKFHR